MNKWLLVFLLPVCCFAKLTPRMEPAHFSTSVVVPCHSKHFSYLTPLLSYYRDQTVLPDEVVICLAAEDWERIPQVEKESFLALQWPFTLQVVTQDTHIPGPGPNRNEGCRRSHGNLLILQDADDIPHPRRVEYIRWLFENFKIDLLIHRWIQEGSSFPTYNTTDLIRRAHAIRSYNDIPFDYVFNGSIAITREVSEKVQWSNKMLGEDIEFNRNVSALFKHKVALDAPLMIYRWRHSSYSQ